MTRIILPERDFTSISLHIYDNVQLERDFFVLGLLPRRRNLQVLMYFEGYWGFTLFLSFTLKRPRNRPLAHGLMRFKHDSPRGAIKKALEANYEVHHFTDAEQLVAWWLP